MNLLSPTRVITIQAEPIATKQVLQLQLTPELRVQKVVSKVKILAETLPPQYQEEVLQIADEWEKDFWTHSIMDSTLDQDKQQAAERLLFFRFNNIEFIMSEYAEDNFEKAKWFEIANELTNIVTLLIPEQVNLAEFIERYLQKYEECQNHYENERVEQMIQELKQTAKTYFKEDKIYERANSINQDLQKKFKEIQTNFLSLNRDGEQATDHLHKQIDQLNNEIICIHEVLEKQLEESKKLAENIDIHEEILGGLLDRVHAVINK